MSHVAVIQQAPVRAFGQALTMLANTLGADDADLAALMNTFYVEGSTPEAPKRVPDAEKISSGMVGFWRAGRMPMVNIQFGALKRACDYINQQPEAYGLEAPLDLARLEQAYRAMWPMQKR